MPIGIGQVGRGIVKATPGKKGPHRGLAWRTPRLSQFNPPSSRIFNASVPTYPTAFADARASSATYWDSSGVLQTAANNTARIDYDPVSHALKGLLVEDTSTNLYARDDDLLSFLTAGLTETTGQAGPAGNTAFKIAEDSSTGQHYSLFSWGGAGSTTLTVSCFFKADVRTCVTMVAGGGQAGLFDLSAGTIIDHDTAFTNPFIISVGNGWYRCGGTVANVNNGDFYGYALCSGTPASIAAIGGGYARESYTGTTGNGVFAFDYMLEASSVTSSPIISSGSQTTRAADSISFTLNASATQLVFTFDDLSTQTVSGLTGGSTYTIPTNLNRQWILYIDDNSGTVTTDNVALAATEAADTAAFVVTETVNAALAATEAQDTAAIVVSVGDNAALAATEAQDVAAIVVQVKDNAALAATEAQDVAAINASVGDNAALAATEVKDVAAINASVGDNVALAATEAQDVALINASSSDLAVLAATEAQDVSAIVATIGDNAALAAIEAKDTAAFIATDKVFAVLAATEASDAVSINISIHVGTWHLATRGDMSIHSLWKIGNTAIDTPAFGSPSGDIYSGDIYADDIYGGSGAVPQKPWKVAQPGGPTIQHSVWKIAP